MTLFFAPERRRCDGFLLRSYRPGDGPAVAAAKHASYAHLAPWMPWASRTETDEDNEMLVRRFRADYLTNRDFTIGVWAPDEAVLWGGTGFHLRDGHADVDSGCGEIGMWIAAARSGRGLGTRVLVAMLQWGFSSEWPWQRLSWRCDRRNVASRRVAERAGMTVEGTIRNDRAEVGEGRRDTLLFGAVRGEWTLPPPDPATPQQPAPPQDR